LEDTIYRSKLDLGNMKRESIINFLRDNADQIRSYGVKTLALFGSVARDEATDKSDVDLLVEFEGKVTFDSYMDLKFFLEDSLGCSVDVVSKDMLKPQIRDIVEREAIYVS
jgi:predicted nucleotidyltransferase